MYGSQNSGFKRLLQLNGFPIVQNCGCTKTQRTATPHKQYWPLHSVNCRYLRDPVCYMAEKIFIFSIYFIVKTALTFKKMVFIVVSSRLKSIFYVSASCISPHPLTHAAGLPYVLIISRLRVLPILCKYLFHLFLWNVNCLFLMNC